jgi:LuxR family transcriptional regulator, positive regulator of biofilm formation
MNILIKLGNFLLGTALQELLARQPEGYRAYVATDSRERLDFRPDFIVVDCYTLRREEPLPQPDAKIILIDCGLSEEEIATLLIAHKIDGVLATTTDVQLFKKALQAINEGQIWIDNRKIKALVHNVDWTKTSNMDDGFSKRERDIIILISQGLMNREIATRLSISEQTVKTHIGHAFRKANVSRRSQLVPFAMKFLVPNTP